MDKKYDIVVVSAFGRGNNIAVDLKDAGLSVALLDVTEGLGRWAPEDWEGPMGLFKTPALSTSALARFDNEDYSDEVEEGFCIWAPEGPIEFRGPTASFGLENLGFHESVRKIIGLAQEKNEKELIPALKKLSDIPYKKWWILDLLFQVTSSTYHENLTAIWDGEIAPVSSQYFIRRVTRKGLDQSLAWVADRGVRVYNKTQIKDLVFLKNVLQAIEVKSDWTGAIETDNALWTLSSLETETLLPQFSKLFYPSGPLKPEWVYVRYRTEWRKNPSFDAIPIKMQIVGDWALPLTHENYLTVQLTAGRELADVWVRIPAIHRFHKDYLEKIGARILNVMNARLPVVSAGVGPLKIVDMPQDYHYDQSVLGPARFGLFEKAKRMSWESRYFANIHFSAPEDWDGLDWTAQLAHQKHIFEDVMRWKLERDKKIQKENRNKEASP